MRLPAASAALATLLVALPAAAQTVTPKVIAYVTGRADLSRIGATKLTHVNYAFAKIGQGGEATLQAPASASHLAQLQALKARNPRLKLILSIGGWGADGFSDAALTPDSRDRFAKSVATLVREFALDGIDLDWEYPGQPGPGIKYRAEDKENFTLLLQAVRRELDALSEARKRVGDDRYTLSIASASGEYFAHTEMDRLHPYLDWVNIMSYDMYGSYTPTTGHHTALHCPATDQAVPCAESMVAEHLRAGIPLSKLVVGAAFFGKSWTGVRPEQGGIRQPWEKYGTEIAYSALLSDFVGQHDFVRRWDGEAKAPSLWGPSSRTFVSYDDPESLRAKAAFVRSRGLGGIMYWEHSHDPDEILLDAIVEGLSARP